MAMSGNQISDAQAGAYEEGILRKLFTAYRDDQALRFHYKGALGNFSGANVFGHDFANDVATGDPEALAKVKKRPGETMDQWVRRLEQDFQGIRFKVKEGGLLEDKKFNDYFNYDTVTDPTTGETAPEAEARTEREKAEKAEADRLATTDQIKAFADELLKPLDENHPEVQRIMTLATNSAQDQARLQGVQGPIAVANVASSTADALGKYNMDRTQLAGQALGNLKDAQVGDFQVLQSQDAQRRAIAQQDWENKAAAAQLRRSSDPGQFIAGAAGGVLGGVAGFFGGGPAGAVAGATGGFNLGKGIYNGFSGGGNYPPPPSFGRSKFGGI